MHGDRDGIRSNDVDDFCANLQKLVLSAAALMHLDVGGMYIGDAGIEAIMIEGVAHSKSLAAVHIQDNKLSHWTRMRIYATLTRSVPLTEDGEPDLQSLEEAHESGEEGNEPAPRN